MNLRQAILQVRYGLDELDEQYWLDDEIKDWLNEGAQLMCSLAQLLQNAVTIRSVSNQQEYVLPEDTDEVESVGYDNGTMLRPVPVAQAMVQVGNRFGGTPIGFYIRQFTTQFQNQGGGNDTSEIAITDIEPGSNKPRKVIGLWPIPSVGNQQIFISYYQRHYTLINDSDEFAIPDEFMRGVIDYATAQAKKKEEAYAEHDKFMTSFKDYAQRVKEKWANFGHEVGFPRMRVRGLSDNSRFMKGTSWVYVGDVE